MRSFFETSLTLIAAFLAIKQTFHTLPIFHQLTQDRLLSTKPTSWRDESWNEFEYPLL